MTEVQSASDEAGPSSLKALKTLEAGAESKPSIRRRWAPTKYITEPPAPPVIDHRQEEEAAAHQAAQEAGYEGRRVRKFLQRRTVDYNGSLQRWKLYRNTLTCVRDDQVVWPGVNHISELLPSGAYKSSAQAVATNLVHSSTNKIRNPVNIIRWTPEGRRLLTGSSSGEFTLWNSLTFNFETILQAHDHAIRALQYTKSGAWILAGDQGGQVKYFQSNMNNLQVINAHREGVRDLSFSPDDSRFVTASDDSTLKIWAFEEAREESTLKGHGWDVMACDWHPFKGLIVSGSKDNLVKFWDPRTCAALATYHGHKGTIQSAQWSKDGNLVATASRDQVVKLYDIRAMAELHTLKGHPNDVCSVDWHPIHHDLLSSGGSEGSILFWSLNAADPGVPVHAMPNAHESNVWSIRWHPLGHIMASGSNDHTTRFWERARPEDGRLGREGQDADAMQASKLQRWNKAVKGGDEWDDDSNFIPGFGTNAKRTDSKQTQPPPPPPPSMPPFPFQSQPPGNGNGMPSNVSDHFRPPGFGFGSGPPQGPPQQQQQQQQQQQHDQSRFVPPPREQYATNDAIPGFGRGYVPPPRDSASMAFNGNNGPNGYMNGGNQIAPQGFVPAPRENANRYVPPPREAFGQQQQQQQPPHHGQGQWPSQQQPRSQYGGGGYQR